MVALELYYSKKFKIMERNLTSRKLQVHRKHGDDNFMQCIIIHLNMNCWREKQRALLTYKCRLIFFKRRDLVEQRKYGEKKPYFALMEVVLLSAGGNSYDT